MTAIDLFPLLCISCAVTPRGEAAFEPCYIDADHTRRFARTLSLLPMKRPTPSQKQLHPVKSIA